jgi:hypothetical protein
VLLQDNVPALSADVDIKPTFEDGKCFGKPGVIMQRRTRTMLKHYQKVLEESLVNSVSNWDAELAMPIAIGEASKWISAVADERKAG